MEITVVGNTDHAAGTVRVSLTRQDKGDIYRIDVYSWEMGPLSAGPVSGLIHMIDEQRTWVDHMYDVSNYVCLVFTPDEGNHLNSCFAWKRFYTATGNDLRNLVDGFINQPHIGKGMNILQVDRLALTLEPNYRLAR